MPAPFQKLTLEEFAALLQRFRFTRHINAVHMHHTWRPNHRQYQGHDSLVAMWRYHTQENHWSDIAQHLTIAPDGTLWTGRNWNLPPASASGHNGNGAAGPFMFEMIGDFDHGRDRFEGAQRDAALKVIALLQKRFNLPAESLCFHHQMSSKSCPGSAIDYPQVVNEVRALHATVAEMGRRALDTYREPLGAEAREWDRMRGLIEACGREVDRIDPADTEPREEAMTESELDLLLSGEAARGGFDGARVELSPQAVQELRPHIVNLNLGQFSSEGRFATTQDDVDAIFEVHLRQALEGARARKEPLRVLLYAHGGLVSESNGLAIARKHVHWWQRNNIYPIYFIWETGFFETIRQLLSASRETVRRWAPRDVWDWTTDPAIEALVRTLQGPRLWTGMKRSAELASADRGGARYLAQKLKAFCDTQREGIQLHAVGHSAGSIFHAHFLPTALEMGVPAFESVHFLAPAIRIDDFHRLLAPRMGDGKGIKHLSLFTMNKSYELDDHCANIYRKSLLYLIHYALEPEPRAPILGLEANLRSDSGLKQLFGLAGEPSKRAAAVWSVTTASTGRSASASTTHGGFDDDPPTMNSIARRILGADDNDPIANYPEPEARGRTLYSWFDQVDVPEELLGFFQTAVPPPPVSPVTVPLAPAVIASTVAPTVAGRKRVLCVGINRYATAPLNGCVADAEDWAAALIGLGFEQPMLLCDEQATYDAILENLGQLIGSSTAGDIIVFQFAGHGTQLPDVDADEAGGDTSGQDEAICPYDFADGRFLIDDDIGEVFDRIPEGVNVTCFIDCCHSGTITRFVAGLAPSAGQAGPNERARFFVATEAMKEAHRRFRASRRRGRTPHMGGPNLMKETLFAAALSSEVAWESHGHGDFTVQATQLLREGIAGFTNEQFLERVREAFGRMPRQHPELYCADGVRQRPFLQPLTADAGLMAVAGRGTPTLAQAVRESTAELAGLLRAMASSLERRAP
jgi:hypothetical protein